MKKTILSILLGMLLAVCFSFGASALTEGDWEFQLLDDEVHITKYLGSGGDVVIPDKIYDRPVTSLKGELFYRNNTITTLSFPGTIKSIPRYCCAYMKKLNTVIFGEGLETIVSYAFCSCDNLEDIVFSQSIKEIDYCAFQFCTSIKELNLPNGIKHIGSSAFEGTGIKEINLPYIETINGGVFSRCVNLEKAVFANNTTSIPNSFFSGCTALKEVVIPGTVESIGGGAFQWCSSLTNIILPTSLKRIERDAFSHCNSLTEVVIPYGTTYMYAAFNRGCTNLKSIYIPDTVTEISYLIDPKSANDCIIYCSKDSSVATACKQQQFSYLTDNSVNSPITVLYNGTRISFHTYDQNPELINSRTLVPLRSVFEAMNAIVEWDAETRTAIATRDGITIKIPIDSSEIYKDGESIPIDVPAQIINSRTMVPVRVIAEAFGADVQWNGNGMTVIITENTEV